MGSLFQRHCSDESLISHLDGELPFYSRELIRRHLERCWRCRLRLSEIESQVLAAVRAMESDAFPGPQRIAGARLQFLNQADRIAAEVFRAQAQRTWLPRLRTVAWAAAAFLLLCGVSVWVFTPRSARSAAAAALERIEAAEEQFAQRVAHQRFRVVEKQLRPETVSRENQLEVWSEPARGRFATSFRDPRGLVRHAIWQPAPDRQYVYHPSRSASAVRFSRREAQDHWDVLRDGVTLEELESELLSWLERRSWRPVSLSRTLAALASADGVVLTAQEIRFSGQSLIRLQGRKTAGAVTVEFVLDVDKRTYAPRLQSIRYQSPQRSLELQLHSEDAPPHALASFEPPESIAAPPTGGVPLPPASTPAPMTPAVPNRALVELEIHRALHSIRACLGETIEVEAGAGGRFIVRGVVVGPERKEQVVAALASLADSGVTVEIKSAQEVLRELPPESVSIRDQPAHTTPSRPRPALQWLAASLGVREPEAEAFAERVLSSGEEFMREAQALRHLAAQFGGRSEFEPAPLRPLVRSIGHDHLKELQGRIASTRRSLAPILGSPATPASDVPLSDLRWDDELLRVFDLARGLNDRLRSLFANADSTSRPDRLIREIGDAFPALESVIAAAAARAR